MNTNLKKAAFTFLLIVLLSACTSTPSAAPTTIVSPTQHALPTTTQAPATEVSATAKSTLAATVPAPTSVASHVPSAEAERWQIVSLVYSPIVGVNHTNNITIVVSDQSCSFNQSKIEGESTRVEIAHDQPGEYANSLECNPKKVLHNFATYVVAEDYQNAELPIANQITEVYPIVGFACNSDAGEANFKTAKLTDTFGQTFDFVVEDFGTTLHADGLEVSGLTTEGKLLQDGEAWAIKSITPEGYQVFNEVGDCGEYLQIVTVVYLVR